MRTRPIAVFDIDDTLADLAGPFAQFLFEKYGDPMFLEDLRKPGIRDVLSARFPQLDIMTDLRELEATGAFKSLPLIPTVFAEYEKLRTSGHEMHLITARGWMLDGEGETVEWCINRGVRFDQLKVVSLEDCKSLHFPPNAAFYYDDHHGHISKCAHLCENAFLINQPWNLHLETPTTARRF